MKHFHVIVFGTFIVMSWVDKVIVWQTKNLRVYRVIQSFRIPFLKISSATPTAKYTVKLVHGLCGVNKGGLPAYALQF